jgi:DNA-binding NarL/FixJ family response regulator
MRAAARRKLILGARVLWVTAECGRTFPVTGRPNKPALRIGLRGDRAFTDRATEVLGQSGIEVVDTASPAAGGANDSSARHLDILVTAIPGDSGAVLAQVGKLREGLPDIPIVAVVDSVAEGLAREMLQAGVRGIVLSGELDQVLAATVRATRAGQVAMPRSARHQVFRPLLSHRENTVLAMVALGRDNTQIATSLHVEESTVKSHIRSLFTKLGVRSRRDAAAAALDGHSRVASGVLAVTDQHR